MIKEIVITKCDDEFLEGVWDKYRAGFAPLYLSLSQELAASLPLSAILEKIEQSLLENFIHPHFPYPIYLIHPDQPTSQMLTVFPKTSYLPKHHQFKSRIPSKKERFYFRKISILKPLLLSLSYENTSRQIGEIKRVQREYLSTLRQLDFLQQLDFTLEELQKEKEKNDRKIK